MDNGPQIQEAVFNRRACKRHTAVCLELADSPGLGGFGIFYILGLVYHDPVPSHSVQGLCIHPCQGKGCNHYIPA